MLGCKFISMDACLSGAGEDLQQLRARLNDDDKFLEYGLEAIEKFSINNRDHHCIIDVGAGFQCASSALKLQDRYSIITLDCDSLVAYKRFVTNRKKRERAEFIQTEFNSHRRRVYESCHHKIDTTNQTKEETANALSIVINGIIDCL